MMTGEEYRHSLSDGRITYLEGERVREVAEHPLLAPAVDRVADGYEWLGAKARSTGSSPLATIPRTPEDLREYMPLIHHAGMVAHVTYASLMTLTTAAGHLAGRSEYVERLLAFVDDAQTRDIRMTECITDAKGDRSRAPSQQTDADAYVRVVDRSRDGVVIRGAKLHITGASLGHELMVIPTKSMRAGEEAYAIACAVGVSSPGVKIVNTTFAPRHTDDRSFPISRRSHYPEGFVIFDDVFVPNERIFLDGEVAEAAVFAHSLGLWERLGGLAHMAEEADALVGFAQLVAEANGLAGVSHIKEKVAEMIIHATMVRGALEASIVHAKHDAHGAIFPHELYINAGKYHAAANYGLMVRHLLDIAGGSVATAPSIADLQHPEIGPLVEKYMATMPGVSGEYRTRLFHAIRDYVADAYGGWKLVSNLQSGGGLFAQRIVSRKHYDMNSAKSLALEIAVMDGADT